MDPLECMPDQIILPVEAQFGLVVVYSEVAFCAQSTLHMLRNYRHRACIVLELFYPSSRLIYLSFI